jgi:hypothetical protein
MAAISSHPAPRALPSAVERPSAGTRWGWTACAFGLIFLADVSLKLGGFGCLHRLVRHWPTLGRSPVSVPAVAERIRDSIDRSRTYYPKRAWCLQASAAEVCLMRLHGVPAQLVLGAQKFPFHAHAWVELDGIVINDDPAVQQTYVTLERC